MKDLAAALAEAQASIKSALKENTGQVGQNRAYKYADLASIWDACKTALSSNGIAVIQKPDFDAGEMWLETMLIHSSGDHVTGRYPIRPTQNTPQAYGSALTYARRYSLSSMVGVVAEDDDGSAASAPPAPPVQREPVQEPDDYEARMAGAKRFVNAGIRALGECMTVAQVDAWGDKHAASIEKLKRDWREEYNALDAAMRMQKSVLMKAAK